MNPKTIQTVKASPRTAQKMKFSIKDFFKKCDLVTFTEEILKGKIHFLCSDGPYFPVIKAPY